MNYGHGSLGFTSKIPAAAIVYAENGTSLAGQSVVLGNDEGDTPAALYSNREIPLDGYYLKLLQLFEYMNCLVISAGNIVPESAIANEGSIVTKYYVTNVQGNYDVDPINDNFKIFLGSGGIE